MSANAPTLARPYARAAFELAKADGLLADWSQRLAFSAQSAATPAIAQALTDPKLGAAKLVSLVLPEGDTADGTFGHFLAVLAENKRLSLLPDITAQYELLRADAERRINARVRTAVVLDESQLDALRAALKRRFGRDIDISNEVDPDVLGGAIIDTGDVVIDGSVRGRLAKLQGLLTH